MYFRIYPKPHIEANFCGFIYVLFSSGQTIIFHVPVANCSSMKMYIKKDPSKPIPLLRTESKQSGISFVQLSC